MLAEDSHPAIPMASVIAKELEIYGSHGMQTTHYPRIFDLIESGAIHPQRLVTNTVGLHHGAQLLTQFAEFPNSGMTIIDFSL
jgi:alcohol dehydrogenase